MIKKIASNITLTTLLISNAFADQRFSLDFYGDSVSNSMIRNSVIESKFEKEKIKEVLEYNNLSWETAKRMPVGSTYLVKAPRTYIADTKELDQKTTSNVEKSRLSSDRNSAHYWLNTELFHHTQKNERANIFSDLSQALEVGTIFSNNLFLSLDLNRATFPEDLDQNITSEETFYRYNLLAGKKIDFEKTDIRFGLYTGSDFFFNLSDTNQVTFESGSTSGVSLSLVRQVAYMLERKFMGKLEIAQSLIASNIDSLLTAEFSISTLIAPLGTKLYPSLSYKASDMKTSSSTLFSKEASLGIEYRF